MAVEENRHAEEIELEGDEDDSLLNDEVQLHRRPAPGSRLRQYCTFSIWWWATNVAMGIVIIYLAFQVDKNRTLLSRYELAGDVTKIGPRLPRMGVVFHAENEYTGNISSSSFKKDTRDLWLSLLPKGLGMIEVKNPSAHRRLPDPYVKGEKDLYRTAINSELNCLYDIMNSINDLILNGGSLGAAKGGQQPAQRLSYCIDYLRQSLMCHGDTALEGIQTALGEDVDATDGWNVRHVCKPWDRIVNWLDRKKVDDSVWD